MNSKAFLISFLAVFAAIAMLSFSSAANFNVSNVVVSFNDVQLNNISTTSIAGITGDSIPVRVVFGSFNTTSNVRVKVSLEGGFRDSVSASTDRFDLVSGSTYNELLNVQLPSDITDITQDSKLYVSIVSDNGDQVQYSFSVKLQRDSYSLDVLSVDMPSQVSAGDTVPVSVVIKNNGMQRLNDGYVIVSIPSLGVASKAYFGDLSTNDTCDDCNTEDSVQKIVNIKLPDTAAPGVYEVDAKVYNQDTVTSATRTVEVGQSTSTAVIATVKKQDIKAGETKTFDLIVVNSGNTIKVYNVQTASGSALSVSAPSVVTVGPQSSTTIPVTVTASKTADLGSYTFSVVVGGTQTSLEADITAGSVSSVVVLTVILAIVFVALLVVLIALLVRKEKPTEEVETSYY